MASLQVFLNEGGAKVGRPIIGANSVTFSKGDPLEVDASGFLIISVAGNKIIGWALEDVILASDNQTVAQLTPVYAEARDVEMVLIADQAAVQGDVGAYANIVGTTSGAFKVNLATGTSGQLFVTQIDPFGTGDTTAVVVKVAENQADAYAQV